MKQAKKRVCKCVDCGAIMTDNNINSVCWASKKTQWHVLTVHMWKEVKNAKV